MAWGCISDQYVTLSKAFGNTESFLFGQPFSNHVSPRRGCSYIGEFGEVYNCHFLMKSSLGGSSPADIHTPSRRHKTIHSIIVKMLKS